MPSAEMTCAVCGAGFTLVDAELAVATDAGPVHADCFEGPVPPGSTGREAIDEAEEEASRRGHDDVPLPWADQPEAMMRAQATRRVIDDHYDPADDRGLEEARHEERYGGYLDRDGIVY